MASQSHKQRAKGSFLPNCYTKLPEIYPFLKDANLNFETKNVKVKPKRKKKSRAEQQKIYQELLDAGEVKNKAAIARKFGVSRAWVTMVLS